MVEYFEGLDGRLFGLNTDILAYINDAPEGAELVWPNGRRERVRNSARALRTRSRLLPEKPLILPEGAFFRVGRGKWHERGRSTPTRSRCGLANPDQSTQVCETADDVPAGKICQQCRDRAVWN